MKTMFSPVISQLHIKLLKEKASRKTEQRAEQHHRSSPAEISSSCKMVQFTPVNSSKNEDHVAGSFYCFSKCYDISILFYINPLCISAKKGGSQTGEKEKCTSLHDIGWFRSTQNPAPS